MWDCQEKNLQKWEIKNKIRSYIRLHMLSSDNIDSSERIIFVKMINHKCFAIWKPNLDITRHFSGIFLDQLQRTCAYFWSKDELFWLLTWLRYISKKLTLSNVARGWTNNWSCGREIPCKLLQMCWLWYVSRYTEYRLVDWLIF
jgi:hypothetical protein